MTNGNRSSVLYQIDKRNKRFKKYLIPAPQNPFYTKADFQEDLVRYRGEDSDEFQRLVLGEHGSASFVLLTSDQIKTEAYDVYSYRYTSTNIARGYREFLKTPAITIQHDAVMLAIDCGFVDPTVIQLFAVKGATWYLVARWRLTRIDFPEQEEIIDWIASHYNVQRIAIDIGAGGGGAGFVHSFLNRPQYATREYARKIVPVNFSEKVTVGFNNDIPYELYVKEYAGEELVRRVQQKELILSELDQEGRSQLERLTKQKMPSGRFKFYISNDRGGASEDDHIFSSYICWVMGTMTPITKTQSRRLARAGNSVTNK